MTVLDRGDKRETSDFNAMARFLFLRDARPLAYLVSASKTFNELDAGVDESETVNLLRPCTVIQACATSLLCDSAGVGNTLRHEFKLNLTADRFRCCATESIHRNNKITRTGVSAALAYAIIILLMRFDAIQI
jgi:hypothetical protein